MKLISLIYGKHWHIFKPPIINATDSTYTLEVIRRHAKFFGPFPLSYISLVDSGRLDVLKLINNSIEDRTPFKMASSQEIAKEDRGFICKLMRLDPRDRPSAKVLLQDAWFTECTTES